MTKISDKIKLLLEFLHQTFPNAKCALTYSKDYELVIAVVLSAQTTDKAVNKVTPILFYHFDSLEKISKASVQDIENDIRSIGLYRNKAKNIKAIAEMIVNDFDSVVPWESKKLLRLPGVGNKTKNVIQAELFKIPSIAVDTHVERIAKRLGLAKANDVPDTVEAKLKKVMEPKDYILANHQIITFGREICKARNPNCSICSLQKICDYFKTKNQK